MDATPQEIFEQHVEALAAGDLDTVQTQYAEDAVVLMTTGEYKGRSAIRALYEELAQALPHVSLEAQATAFAGNLLLVTWTADSAVNTVADGVDTFVFDAGRIRAQTISCTLKPKAAGA